MSGPELQRMESYQYPATHVGHLNAEQARSLESFKKLCEQKGYFRAEGVNGRPSHDDETMLRYLRARKFNPSEAFTQFKDTEDWRKENQLDKLYDTIDVGEYDQTRVLYPQWTGRRDRRGIPVYLFEVAHLNSKAVTAYETSTTSKNQSVTSKVPVKMLRLFALYENLVNFVLPLCSAMPNRPYPETPVSQSSNIVDISNVGLRQFWSLKSHMQDASQLATAHYPETLDRIFIIGAPSFFPTVWSWIKRWFDPITVSKIFILSREDMYQTLEQYIEPENIPKQYGGKLEYKFGELPNMEPAIAKALSWQSAHKLHGKDTIPTGPIRWEPTESGDKIARAVGTENGKPRNRKVATLHTSDQVAQASLGAGRQDHQKMYRTTSGVDTHPPTPPQSEVITETPRSHSPVGAVAAGAVATGAGAGALGTVPGTAQPGGTYLAYRGTPSTDTGAYQPSSTTTSTYQSSSADTSTYQPSSADTSTYQPSSTDTVSTKTSANQPSSTRDGTSNSRFEDQSHTHAHGTVRDGTPHTREGVAGDRYAVMEPNTVGQAPKEHPMPEAPAQPEASYVDQAKDVAAQAYNTAAGVGASALAAVGLGGKEEPKQQEEQVPKKVEDPRVDQTHNRNVEEFLRDQYPSKEQEIAKAAKQ